MKHSYTRHASACDLNPRRTPHLLNLPQLCKAINLSETVLNRLRDEDEVLPYIQLKSRARYELNAVLIALRQRVGSNYPEPTIQPTPPAQPPIKLHEIGYSLGFSYTLRTSLHKHGYFPHLETGGTPRFEINEVLLELRKVRGENYPDNAPLHDPSTPDLERDPGLLTLLDLAKVLNIPILTLRNLKSEEKIPYLTLSSHVRFEAEAVYQALRSDGSNPLPIIPTL